MSSIAPIAPKLLKWYDQNKANLPWRQASTPYTTWLSEIMLQQTQIETVLPYYKHFLQRYPTVHDLANAPLDNVLKSWEGLGYYSRARNLHQTAKTISQEYDGQFPTTVPELMKLKGIGRYTAGAIASIAFNTRASVLDGNVIRVLTRLGDIDSDVTETATKNRLWDVADSLLPKEHEDARYGDYNQALMELGQKICTPKNPKCSDCPVQAQCQAFANQTQFKRPVKKKRAPIPHYDVAAGIIRRDDGMILIAQRLNEGLLGGLWEFPGGKQEEGETLPETLKRELQEELAIEVEVEELFIKVRHAFTHFKITLHTFDCHYIGAMPPYDEPQAIEAQAWQWVTEADFEKYSFGKADREIIKALNERKNLLL